MPASRALIPLLLLPLVAAAPRSAAPGPLSAGPRDGGQMCLPSGIDANPIPLDKRHLFFPRRAGDRTGWVSDLGADCTGLEPIATIIVDKFGGQLCRGDHIRTLRPGEIIPGPVCILGRFTPGTRPARKGEK